MWMTTPNDFTFTAPSRTLDAVTGQFCRTDTKFSIGHTRTALKTTGRQPVHIWSMKIIFSTHIHAINTALSSRKLLSLVLTRLPPESSASRSQWTQPLLHPLALHHDVITHSHHITQKTIPVTMWWNPPGWWRARSRGLLTEGSTYSAVSQTWATTTLSASALQTLSTRRAGELACSETHTVLPRER